MLRSSWPSVAAASVGLDVSGESIAYVAGWGEDGAHGASSDVAASGAYLHPLADAHQVKHILGAAAHAARAAELMAADDRDVGADHIEQARRRASSAVVDVLIRYPAAPPGGGRVGELLRDLDEALRGRFEGLVVPGGRS